MPAYKPRNSNAPERRQSHADKLAKAAMSKEMLAAGLAAAAAAISASPAARRKIRDAGLNAGDTAAHAATNVMTSATQLGSLIAEAVAEAAQRVMSGKWDAAQPRSMGSVNPRSVRRRSNAGQIVGQKTTDLGSVDIIAASGKHVSLVEVKRSVGKLARQVEQIVEQSGDPEGFDADEWVSKWVQKSIPALGGKRPIDILETPGGYTVVSSVLARTQSGAYA